MPKPKKSFQLMLTDDDVAEAYLSVSDQIPHTDSPTESDLCLIRCALKVKDAEMISLHWLRNKVVALRKKSAFKPDAPEPDQWIYRYSLMKEQDSR